MSFGRMGGLGRGFGRLGTPLGGVGISSPYAFWQANPSAQGAWFRWDMTGELQAYTTIGAGASNPNDGETLALSIGKYQSSDTIGSNLVTNGDFANGLTGWTDASTLPSAWTVVNGVATSSTNGSATARLRQAVTVEVGCAYLVQHDGTCPISVGSTNAFTNDLYSSSTAFDTIIVATTTGFYFSFPTTTNGLTVDNLVVKKIPGFAARQSSASLRPLWKANLGGYRLPDGIDDVDTVTFPASFTGDIVDYNPLTGVVTEQVGVSIGTSQNLPNRATRHVVIMPSGYDSWRAKIVAWMKAQAIGLYGVADGDSHTKNSTFLSSPQAYFPALLSKTLQGEGRNIVIGNFGVGGSTSADCLTRANAMSGVSRQAFSLIYVGTNDGAASNQSTVQASPSPTTTSFSVASGKGALFPAGCQIFVGSDSRTVVTQVGDAITVAALSGAPSAGTTVKLDTRQNIVKIGQRLQAIGFTNLLVGVMHYYDYTDGTGDTLAAENATQATLRALQRLAATDLGATQVDFYAYMRALLVAGTYTPLSAAWHVANTDPHLNAIGQGILRDAIRAAIPSGWI